MRAFRYKLITANFELFVVCASLVTILATTCYATRSHQSSMYERCMDGCRMVFFRCIRSECHGRSWPLPVSQECINKRSSCIDGCRPLKLIHNLT
ncbi:hypothetical protein LSAT2_005545 [Lamellibrachia satsuma]|nr:hypothetical protein LSAT2_005545 [Lamellibrachia satsuma]